MLREGAEWQAQPGCDALRAGAPLGMPNASPPPHCTANHPVRIATFPHAQVRHIGLFRDEQTLQPVEYYVKLPPALEPDTLVLILDPTLATGGSAIAAIDLFKHRGISRFKFICLIAAPEGVHAVHNRHPDVPIYTASVDSHLNERGYIIPGLGDAGDRCFGTT